MMTSVFFSIPTKNFRTKKCQCEVTHTTYHRHTHILHIGIILTFHLIPYQKPQQLMYMSILYIFSGAVTSIIRNPFASVIRTAFISAMRAFVSSGLSALNTFSAL